MLDGLFQQALLGHVAGRADALDELRQQVREVVPLMLTARPAGPGAADRIAAAS
jgi:TetR/AcrR family transcriptional repressor of bet genes